MMTARRGVTLLLAASGFACALEGGTAHAQCGAAASECRHCHEARDATMAARAPAPWHSDHAFADLCAVCHGGDPAAKDEHEAHRGLLSPLADPAATCGSCHGAESATLARSYATAPAPPPPAASAAPTAARASAPRHVRWANLGMTAALLLVVVGGGALVLRNERRLRGRSPEEHAALPRENALARSAWSPYAAGAGLGLTATLSMTLFHKRLSGAGAYQHLSGYLGRSFSPDNLYWKHVVPTGLTWEVLLVFGTFVGALVSAVAGSRFAIRTMPDSQWSDVFGPSVARRWLLVFLGTVVLELAAGFAGGCTASLAVSGGVALAPGAFLFMAGMLAGGIPVARLLYRRTR